MNVKFAPEHLDPKEGDSQLLLAITGSREFIIERLKLILEDCEGSYGKPYQGIHIFGKGISQVITPKWKGKQY